MTPVATTVGVDGFLTGLQRCGVEPAVNGTIVVFTVAAAARSGPLTTQTGVAVTQLQAWPAVPPHWIHLPASVTFTSTNVNPDETLPGWLRHSRNIIGWGDAHEPAQAWLAHLRSVLQEAQ